MNIENLMTAIKELMEAQDEEEFNSTLQKYPNLLSEENISVLETAAKVQSDWVNFLYYVAQRRGGFSLIEAPPGDLPYVFAAFQREVAAAETIEEIQPVLQKYPEMLSETMILWLGEQVRDLRQIAGFLRQTAQGNQAAGGWQPRTEVQPIISEPTVRWAELARKYLALQRRPDSENFLVEAIDEAQKINEPEIVEILERLLRIHELNGEIREAGKAKDDSLQQILNFQLTDNLNNLIEKSPKLSDTYAEAKKLEEAITLRLIFLNPYISYTQIPPTIDEQARQIYQTGMQFCEEAIFFSQLLSDKACQANYLTAYGTGHAQWRRWRPAKTAFVEALQIRRKLKLTDESSYEPDIALTLNNLGIVLIEMRLLGDAENAFAEALRIYKRLAEADQATYEPSIAMTLNNLGNALRTMRRLNEADNAFAEALRIYKKLAEADHATYESMVASTLNNLGTVFLYMRRFAQAETAFAEGLRIYQKLAEVNQATYELELAKTLNSIGAVFRKIGRFTEAETAFAKALRIYEKLTKADEATYKSDAAMTLNNLGTVLTDMQRFAEAETVLAEALQIYVKLAEADDATYEPSVAMTLNNLGAVLRKQDKTSESKEKYQKAAEICEKKVLPVELSAIYSNLGQISLQAGNWKEAADFFDKAINWVEVLRNEAYEHLKDQFDDKELSEEKLKRNDYIRERAKQMLEENFTAYEGKFVALIKLGRKIEAIEASEKGKSRTINDLLFQRAQGLTGSTAIYRPTDKTRTAREITELAEKSQKTIISFRITENYGSYAFINFPDGESDIVFIENFNAQKLAELLVKYEQETPVAGWLFRYDKYCQWISLLISYSEADKAKDNATKEEINQIYKSDEAFQDADKKWFTEIERVLGELDNQLMSKVRRGLQKKALESELAIKDLVVIPNRALAILPLHACWWIENGERKYWLDDYIMTYAPSLGVFQTCWEREQNGRSNEKILAISNPSGDLTDSEKECREIKNLFGQRCETVVGEQATKTKVTSLIKQRNWLHFSCHGIYDFAVPFESYLQLADMEMENDGNLKLQEIMEQFDLNHTWLTVLSACETGLGEYSGGVDEYYGLPLGFILAGTPSVWGTLWSVRDDATKELMCRAYQNLNKGLSKPKALRQAQIDLRKDATNRFSHPYFWAGIQSFGA